MSIAPRVLWILDSTCTCNQELIRIFSLTCKTGCNQDKD